MITMAPLFWPPREVFFRKGNGLFAESYSFLGRSAHFTPPNGEVTPKFGEEVSALVVHAGRDYMMLYAKRLKQILR